MCTARARGCTGSRTGSESDCVGIYAIPRTMVSPSDCDEGGKLQTGEPALTPPGNVCARIAGSAMI